MLTEIEADGMPPHHQLNDHRIDMLIGHVLSEYDMFDPRRVETVVALIWDEVGHEAERRVRARNEWRVRARNAHEISKGWPIMRFIHAARREFVSGFSRGLAISARQHP